MNMPYKKKKPDLSIIIVSYNSRNYLDQCLKSLSKTKLKPAPEIIVVDNCSVDGTAELMNDKYKNIRLILNKKNTGFAAANNQGIKLSNGKYVLLLNPDTIVPPDCLPYMVAFMEKNPKAAVATCYIKLADGNIDDACHRGFPTPWNAFCHFSGMSKIFPHSLLFNGYHLGYRKLGATHEIDSCTGAFMLARRSVGETINWLDEDYFWYGEDLDFCFRVKKDGYAVYFVPQVYINHFKGISSGIKKHSQNLSKATFETKYRSQKARFAVMRIFYSKHYQKGINSFLAPFIFFFISLNEKLTLLNLKFVG